MVLEIIRALIIGALPVAAFTFLTLQWSIETGRLDKFTDKNDLNEQFKKRSKEAKEAKKKSNKKTASSESEEKKPFFHKDTGGDFIHSKLMFFGGGFYGTMAIFTYIIVEAFEIISFLGKIIDLSSWRFSFSIEFVIDLIINSIMNIVKAFIWFSTLPDYVDVNEGFVWLGAVYLGYLIGMRFTQEKGTETWRALADKLAEVKKSLKSKFRPNQP